MFEREKTPGNLCQGNARKIVGCALLLCAAPSLRAAKLCVNPGGTGGCTSSISAAVVAASAGDIIQVAAGTYKEQVVISKSLSLVADSNRKPVIDASGLNTGFFVNGMSAAPNPGVTGVVISGFEVENAKFEGILVANATDVTLFDNSIHDNNKALDIASAKCNGVPDFETNEDLDCGEGIHLMGTSYVSVVRNDIAYNSGGILISDETGPSHANLISRNSVHDNPFDCGITLASHGPAISVVPTAHLPFGITANTISQNVSSHNGYAVPGAGAGVGIFAPFPGTTDAGNVVIDNVLTDNGLPGVTMHNHAWAPSPAPPVNMNDNVIVGNRISGNGPDTEDALTSGPTGINVFSRAPVWGTTVSQNVFQDEAIDVAFNAPAGQINAHFNNFIGTGLGVDNLGGGTVDATENWWKCPKGPGQNGCAGVSGSGVTVEPWLTSPLEPNQ